MEVLILVFLVVVIVGLVRKERVSTMETAEREDIVKKFERIQAVEGAWRSFRQDLQALAANPRDAAALASARATGLAWCRMQSATIETVVLAKVTPSVAEAVAQLSESTMDAACVRAVEKIVEDAMQGELPKESRREG